MKPFEYSAPGRLDEAVALLASTAGSRVIAGGSQMLVEPWRSALSAPLLVDLRRIDGLTGVEGTDGLRIGAMTTMADVAAHAGLRSAYAALAEAASQVGDAQIRNRATMGGALASDDPGADLPAALLALDALVNIVGQKGARAVRVDEVLGALGSGDIIVAITLAKTDARWGSAYEKIRHPSTFYALCGVATSVTLDGNGAVRACRIAITGAAAPARATAAEAALVGREPTTAAIEAAAGKAADGLTLRGDAFGSPEYRGHLARVLTARALARTVTAIRREL